MSTDFDLKMAYHMGYEDALAKRMPEPSKAAVLGRGTCHMEESWHGATEVYEYRCTSCDEYAHIEVVKPDGAQPPRYCPNCGRRVES